PGCPSRAPCAHAYAPARSAAWLVPLPRTSTDPVPLAVFVGEAMRQGNGQAGFPVHPNGTVADAIAAVLKREGVDIVFGYPRNHVLEAAARIDIRTVIVRQERTGIHMADALSRMSKGARMGVFVMQQGPGAENAMGGVAQAFADSVPVL